MMHGSDRNRLGIVPWIGLAFAAGLVLWLGWSWSQARREVAALRGWQAAMLHRIADARGGDTPLDPDRAFDALAHIVAARDATVAATRSIAAATPPPPSPRAPDTDSGTEITRLRRTQSTGTAAGDAQIIEQDSRAAWTGWK